MNYKNSMNFKKLRIAMIEHDLKTKDIAAIWGVTISTASAKINGLRAITLPQAQKLAAAMDLTPHAAGDIFFAK